MSKTRGVDVTQESIRLRNKSSKSSMRELGMRPQRFCFQMLLSWPREHVRGLAVVTAKKWQSSVPAQKLMLALRHTCVPLKYSCMEGTKGFWHFLVIHTVPDVPDTKIRMNGGAKTLPQTALGEFHHLCSRLRAQSHGKTDKYRRHDVKRAAAGPACGVDLCGLYFRLPVVWWFGGWFGGLWMIISGSCRDGITSPPNHQSKSPNWEEADY